MTILFILIKFILIFLLLQQIAFRSPIRGLIIQWKGLHQPWISLVALLLFFFVYPSPTFVEHWFLLLFPVTLLTLILAIFYSTPAFLTSPHLHECTNGIQYYLFPSKNKKPEKTFVFLHGSGNDALFDNFELFNHWYTRGHQVISINLPGHGLKGKTILTPETSLPLLMEAWKEIQNKHFEKERVIVTGESLGAKFALRLGLEFPSINEAHLLCYPMKVSLSKKGIVLEVLHFFFFQLWWRLSSNTFWDAIPSFSRFKRGLYPLRYESETAKSSLQVYQNIIHHLEENFPSPTDYKNPHLQIVLFHGINDGAVPYQQSLTMKNKLEKESLSTKVVLNRGFHLSIKRWYLTQWLF